MTHNFRHHEYIHIKPVLILCLVAILLLIGGAVTIYFATKPKSKLYESSEKDDQDAESFVASN